MILINGQAGDSVSAFDRGLQYGDGLFETIAVRDGAPRLWDRHMARLADGCRRLRLPEPDRDTLAREAAQLCAGTARAVLKLVITRGPGTRGYRITPADPETAAARATRIVMLLPAPERAAQDYRDGIALRLCTTRLGSNPALAGIKHLNRLEQVLARDEWDDPEVREGLMRDRDGALIAGTMSNLFVVTGGAVRTPALGECGVAGVMRGFVMDAAPALGIAVSEGRLTVDALDTADEIFMCNSLIGIWPVRRFEARTFAIGPVTRQLMVAVNGESLAP